MTATDRHVLLRVVCGPCRSRRKADGQVQEHLPIQTLIGRAMVLVTMRSSGEVQPPGAVHGAGIDPARALLRRHRFRSKASWHGERHWQPAANWIPQPRSARIHWMGVSGAVACNVPRLIPRPLRGLSRSCNAGLSIVHTLTAPGLQLGSSAATTAEPRRSARPPHPD